MKNFDWRGLLRHESGSVLMIVFGVLLTMKPDFASAVVSAVLGWVLIAVGVVLIISGCVERWNVGRIVAGVLVLLLGNWIHRNPLMIASAIGIVLGLLVLSQGWEAAKDAQRVKRCGGMWVPGAVLAVAELLIGVRLVLSPLTLSRLVLSILGIVMVVCGACSLVAHYNSVRYIPEADVIIDADK